MPRSSRSAPCGAYQQDTLNSAFRVLQFCADDSSGRACHGKAAAAVRRRHRGLVSGGVRRGGPHARLLGAGPMRIMFQKICKMLSKKFGHGKSFGFANNHPLQERTTP